MISTSPNSRHTAMFRSAQLRQSQTSYVRKPLYDIASQYNLDEWGDMNDKQESI